MASSLKGMSHGYLEAKNGSEAVEGSNAVLIIGCIRLPSWPHLIMRLQIHDTNRYRDTCIHQTVAGSAE